MIVRCAGRRDLYPAQRRGIGKDIKEVLGLNKEIIEFEITSNRPDCLSIIGLAREAAVTLKTSSRGLL